MNISRRFHFAFRLFVSASLFVSTLFTFSSCENFLNGEDIKEEIVKTIEYSNADSYEIDVEVLDVSCGAIKTPATGSVIKKVTDSFTVRFQPAADHKFIKWEAVVKGMSTGERESDYIEFENSESLETKVVFKKASASVIVIRPVCPPRLTYKFTQGGGDLYPRDSSIELIFNQKLSNCNFNNTPISYVTIPNLAEGEDASKYFQAPVVTNEKILFRADTREGTNFIPVPNNSRSIQVRIPKEDIWYVNKEYKEEVKVYLDEDIAENYLIGTQTSAKTKIKYQVRQSEDELPVGNLKINGTDNDNQLHEYSVGDTINLRYKVPEGYTFRRWKFLNSKGEELKTDELSISLSDDDNTNNLVQLTITIDNQIKDEITIIPEITDPVIFKLLKTSEDKGTLKAGTVAVSQEEQTLEYGIGDIISLTYKLPAGYYFYGWEYSKTYKNQNNVERTDLITTEDLKKLGIDIVYDKDGDENGYEKATRIATAQITISEYTDNIISIKPVSYENLQITKFKLDDEEKTYERDSDIVFTFNKPLAAACKDNVTIKIPGLPEGKTAADYFEPAVIDGKTLTIKPKKATSTQLIPLLTDGTNTITVSLKADKLYYETKATDNSTVKVGLEADKTYTYKIDANTKEKTKIKVQYDSENAYGTLKVNNVSREDEIVGYSIGSNVSITHTLSKNDAESYYFKNWKLFYTSTNAAGKTETKEIDIPDKDKITIIPEIKIQFSSDEVNKVNDIPVQGASILILDNIDGLITIQPELEEIKDVEVEITGTNGKFTPSKGNQTYKLGKVNQIEFEADSDYEFIRWMLINSVTGKEIEKNSGGNYEYLRTRNLYNSKLEFEMIALPEESENIQFELQPLIAERPQIISNAPLYSSSGVLRDTTIQVMFDYDMDKDSIYLTDGEVTDLTKQGITNFLSVNNDDKAPYYGYTKGGETYFKNISITDSDNNNIIECFKAPIFENPRRLSIPVKTSLDPGTNVMVTLEKDFFRLEEGKEVTMGQTKKWLYLVNGDIDDKAPEVPSFILKDPAEKDFSGKLTDPSINSSDLTSLHYIKSDTFKLGLKVHDNTAPDSAFILNLEKLYDSSYKADSSVSSKTINYTTCYGENAVYGKETHQKDANNNTVSVIEPLPYKFENLSEGIYALTFTFKDRSGNSVTYPQVTEGNTTKAAKYYFCLDNTAPDIAAPVVTDSNSNATSLILTWDKNDILDYKGAVIKYRKWGTTNYTSTSEDDLITGNTYTLTNLIPGTHYEIVAEYYDYAGHVTTVPVDGGAYTRPDAPKSVTQSAAYGERLTLTGTKSDKGNFTDMRIRYSINDGSTWTEYANRITEENPSQILVLPKGYKYTFDICSYDSESGKYSLPYYISGTRPSFITIPDTVSVDTSFMSYTNQGKVSWTKGSGNYSGFIVYCSTDSSFPDTTATLKETITSSTTLSKTFTNLTPGTYYYCKVEPYYVNTDIKNTSTVRTTYTLCDSPKSFTCTPVSYDTINVSWERPDGNFNSYKLEYKKHSASVYTSLSLSNNSTSHSLKGIAGGDSYDFKLTTVGVTTGMNSSVEQKDVKNHPSPARNFKAEKVAGSELGYKVSWSAPASGNYDGYRLYQASSVAGLSSSSATVTTYTKSDESSGVITINKTAATGTTLLYFKVETYIGSLTTVSDPVCCSFGLDPVKNLSVKPDSPTSIKLTWTNLSADAYDGIWIYMDGTLKQTITSKATTSYTQTDLSPNTNHNFTVTTYKNDTVNGKQYTAEAIGSSYTYSTPITSMSVAANGPKSVKVSWTKPSNAIEWTQLFIYCGNEYVDYWYPTHTTTSCNYSVAAGGTEYTYKIVTLNEVETEYTAGAITRTLITPPEPATNVTLTSNTATSVTLSWTKPGGNYTGIKIYKKLSSESTYPTSYTTYVGNSSTSTTITGLTAGTSYDFKLETYLTNVTNVGETSQTSITGVYTRPYAPTNFSLSSRTASSMKFAWTKPSGTYTGYVLKYKKSTDSSYTTVEPSKTATSYTINNLSPGTIYNAYLVAYNPNSSSNMYLASTSTITNATPLAAPTNLKTEMGNGNIILSWNAPTNASSNTTEYLVTHISADGEGTARTTKTSYEYPINQSDAGTTVKFKVQAINTLNSETLESAYSSIKEIIVPPAKLEFNSLPSIWSDDGMGTVILHWVNKTGRTDVAGIYIYIGTTRLATVSYRNGATVNQVVKIPNYRRGGSYTFKFVPYYSTEEGPAYEKSLTTSSGNLKVEGYSYSNTALKNVVTSTYRVYWNSNSDNNLPGTDVNSTKFDENVGKSYAFSKNRASVYLTPYSIGAYEVTQGLYEAVMGGNSSNWKGSSYPVSNVNWYQAIAFCNKLSVMQGLKPCYKYSSYSDSDWLNVTHTNYPTYNGYVYDFSANGYHLPTECQFELAGHGGTASAYDWNYKYPGSNNRDSVAVAATSSYKTVGSLSSNSLGLYDICGNVREWTSDWWSETGNRPTWTGSKTDPQFSYSESWANLTSGIVVKGCDYQSKGTSNGSIDSKCWGLRGVSPSTADKQTGFRLCRNVTY